MSQNRGPKFATSKIFFFSVRRKKNFCNTSSLKIDENYLISRYHVLLRLLRLADVRYTPPPPSLAFTQMRTFPFSDLRIPTLSLCIQSLCGERERERWNEEGKERRSQRRRTGKETARLRIDWREGDFRIIRERKATPTDWRLYGATIKVYIYTKVEYRQKRGRLVTRA